MKINLVNPPYSNQEYIPLGLLSLKGFLKENYPNSGIKIKIIDLNKSIESGNIGKQDAFFCKSCYTKKELDEEMAMGFCGNSCLLDINKITADKQINDILKNDPDIIGFSIFNSFQIGIPSQIEQLSYSLFLAEKIKYLKKDVKIIFGGAALYSDKQNNEIMNFFNFLDFIIKGPGEVPFLSLLKELEKNSNDFRNIPSLLWREGGKVIKNEIFGSAEFPHSMPDFSDINLNSYKINDSIVLPVKFSYGCSWGRCKFCTSNKFSKYRQMHAVHIEKIINYYLKELKIRDFILLDDLVTPTLFNLIAGLVKKNKWNISYIAQSRPTSQFTKSLLKDIYFSGCKMILWGVESFSQRLLNTMCKGTNVAVIVDVLKKTYKAGIYNSVFYILGLPGQNLNDLKQDSSFIKKNMDYIQVIKWSYFRLDIESTFYKNLCKNNRDFLISKYKNKNYSVHCLTCKYTYTKTLTDYFQKNIMPFIISAGKNFQEREFLAHSRQKCSLIHNN